MNISTQDKAQLAYFSPILLIGPVRSMGSRTPGEFARSSLVLHPGFERAAYRGLAASNLMAGTLKITKSLSDLGSALDVVINKRGTVSGVMSGMANYLARNDVWSLGQVVPEGG
jgi:hypothetical protein